jgi:thiamine pyrophosphate-dependent acetolactate synthase large subunit-like protein
MQAFGGEGYAVNSRQQLLVACRQAFAARRPALINVAIDTLAGVESGVPAVMCMLSVLCTHN